MSRAIALCLDEDSQKHPEYVGLEGESFLQQSWLELFDSGMDARSSLQEAKGINEVWVVSCNDVEPINLAASVKDDRPDLLVRLIASHAGGSLRSRANTANIDEVLELSAFVRIYLEAKNRTRQQSAQQKEVLQQKESPISDERRVGQEESDPTLKAPLEGEDEWESGEPAKRMFGEQGKGARLLDLPDPRYVSSDKGECDSPLEQADVKAPLLHKTVPFKKEEEAALLSANESFVGSPKDSIRSEQTRKGFLMSIMSGSGGTGKSTISVLAALDVANKGYRTLLMDCDLQFGDITYLLRDIPSVNVDKILNDSELKHRTFSLNAPLVVIGAPERFEASELIAGRIADFISEAAQHFDVIIVNTGSNWSEQHAVLLEKSSTVLFLVDQRSSSLRTCSHALELCARCGIASVPFRFALNRCSKNAPFTASEVAKILQNSQVFELSDGGEEVEECFASGNVFELQEQGNELAVSIDHMMSQILPQTERGQNVKPDTSLKVPLVRRRLKRLGKKRMKVAL